MVDREITLTYQDLIDRKITEGWLTLNCVSNPVGGDAHRQRLVERRPRRRAARRGRRAARRRRGAADLGRRLDLRHSAGRAHRPGRGAMLAIAMNGEPLPIDHGFPVRMLVPGLYGYVSATKWVVDLEVSRFDDITAYWTDKGWSEQGPVKLASRIEVPEHGDEVPVGELGSAASPGRRRSGSRRWSTPSTAAGGSAPSSAGCRTRTPGCSGWPPSTSRRATTGCGCARSPPDDEVQTGVEQDVRPDGATGWHEVEFSAG